MNCFVEFESLENKLAEVLDEHKLVHTFKAQQYPISLIISQNQSPDAQLELFETSDNSVSSKDASLTLIFGVDGIEIRTSNRLIISDALMGKIKNFGKKMLNAYTYGFFATEILKKEIIGNTGDTPAAPALYDPPAEEDTDEFADFYGEPDPADVECPEDTEDEE